MKTEGVHFARSATLTEYLRYIWSRPAPARIAVESTFLSSPPLPVPIKTSTRHQSVLASDFNRRSGAEKPAPLGRLGGRGILSLLLMLFCLVVIGAGPAQAQTSPCPETNVLKFVQFPRTDGGYDVWDSGPFALADDFICTNTGPITDIHLWAGWLNDIVDFNTTFWLGIYEDVPAVTNGPVLIPSRPSTNLVWQQYFFPGQYSQSLVAGGIGNFYNPEPPGIMGNEVKTYYYCFYPTNPPVQTGTTNKPKIYWLAVYAMPSQATSFLFGWKSAQFQQFDISTRTPWGGTAPITTDWRPNYDLNNFGLDLAFKINTATNQPPPPPPCCPETNGVKFVQYPKVPSGVDVNASQNLTLADDFLCTNTGPVTDIHLWGSWLQDKIDPNVLFTLTIWSDVPKQTNGGTIIPSHPGIQLWSEPFGPGEYYQCPYTNITEQFYDPSIPAPIGFDTNVYYLCFYPRQPFRQQGTAAVHTNYWLSVNAQTTASAQTLFGWHSSYQFYNDTAVWGAGPAPAAWNTMADPFGNPLSMAFKVTTPTNEPPPPPCCPETNGVKFVQHPQVPGGLDVNATRNPAGQPLVLADDFQCTNTGPVTDIHLWGSWLQDRIDPNVLFTLSIWSDVPKKTNGTVVVPSHPGIPLWSEPFGPGEYYQCLYTNRVEQFYDASLPAIMGLDTNVYYLCFYPKNPFVQQGTATATTNYWLSVSAQTAAGSQQLFGWHTSYEYYNDTAVWGNGPMPPTWTPMTDPQGIPLSMAFKVTTPTNPPCPTTFICPPNKTNECGSAWTFDDPRATNACCGTNVTLIIIDTKTNGTCPQFITRNWLVTDCAGNTANCSQTVVIVDTTPPVFTFCPTNRTVECGSPWSFGTPTAQDNCCFQGISVFGTFTNTGICPQIITRVWVAYDCCGNTNVCSQRITIVDTTPPVFTPGVPGAVVKRPDMFSAIRKDDILLHHPYQSFRLVINFIEQAAKDPDVVAIKQTVYRTGVNSEMMQILVDAAQRGKEITVVVELLARFDEEANINWASQLEEVGAHVVYGIVGHKTHAKLALVVRREEGRLRRYCHLGTGNYHSRTAMLYTDFGMLSCNEDICADVNDVFMQLTSLGKAGKLRHLWQSPFTLHTTDGATPSGPGVSPPSSIWAFRPATRISKNSSKLLLTMHRNRNRSSSGTSGSAACASTRRLNSS
jgi:hypothetical protein